MSKFRLWVTDMKYIASSIYGDAKQNLALAFESPAVKSFLELSKYTFFLLVICLLVINVLGLFIPVIFMLDMLFSYPYILLSLILAFILVAAFKPAIGKLFDATINIITALVNKKGS